MVSEEFEKVTKPLINFFWNEGYFTIPLPGAGLKEFRLDMPAFERFDIVIARWDGEGVDDIDVGVVECKLKPDEGVPQARTYQLCVPKVYVASNRKADNKLAEKLNRYGLGYIEVSNGSPRIVLEPRRSMLFNANFYRSEVLPRVVTLLLFHDFMIEFLGMSRDKILEKVDYSLQKDYLWISHVRATESVQWTAAYEYEAEKGVMRFGLNIESTNAVKTCFHGRSLEEARRLLYWLREFLPGNFILRFDNRCPEYPKVKFKPGMRHKPFKDLGWSSRQLLEVSDEDLDFIAEKVRIYPYVEFGLWIKIFTAEELFSWTRRDLLKRMKYYKEKYLDEVVRRFHSRAK